jgi:hypothetical protein
MHFKKTSNKLISIKIKFRPKNIVYILSVFLLYSCSVYYTTSELDNNLKTYINGINKNQKITENAFHKSENEFNKLKYTGNKEPFSLAIVKLKSLQKSSDLILNIKLSANNEYKQFQKYSKGKNKILSGSDEWKRLKNTKKGLKQSNKDLKKELKNFNTLANEYLEIMNEQIAPIVKIYNIRDFQENHQQIIIKINKFKKELSDAILKYESIYLKINKKYNNTHSEECKQLEQHLSSSKKKMNEIPEIESNIKSLFIKFNNKTKGIKQVYSTYDSWNGIEKIDSDIKIKLNEITSIKNEISKHFNSFQTITNQISGQ